MIIPSTLGRSRTIPTKGLAFIVLFCALAIGLLMLTSKVGAGHSTVFVSQVLISDLNSEESSNELAAWVRECDNEGRGVYVLQSEQKIEDLILTKILLYRNDGYYKTDVSFHGNGFLNDISVAFTCTPYMVSQMALIPECSIAYFEYIGRNGCTVDVDGNKCKTFLADDFYVYIPAEQNILTVELSVAEGLPEISRVGWALYRSDERLLSELSEDREGNLKDRTPYQFSYRVEAADQVTSFLIYALDDKGTLIYKGDRMLLEDGTDWDLELDKNGDRILVMQAAESQ